MEVDSLQNACGSFVENLEFITPSHSYHDNTAFGGQLFSWMDSAASISVMKHSGMKAVTASVDELYFLKPVNTGFIVNVQAKIIATFQSSCQVRALVTAMGPRLSTKTLVALGFFTMVVLDSAGKPHPIPPIHMRTQSEEQLSRLAVDLRQMRQIMKPRLLEATLLS